MTKTRHSSDGRGAVFWQNDLASKIPQFQRAEIGLNIELCVFGGLFVTDAPTRSKFPWGIQMKFYNWSI